jgi:VWFA-related protein
MRKTTAFLMLLSMLFACAQILLAQGRPRRAVQTTQTSTPTQTPAQNPTQPPVLGGANRPSGSQTNAPTKVTADGPEEVAAGDVIKVNTTLVTLPVSVMDRDGRYIPNLRKEDFRLWEDGVEQSVAFFSAVDKPFSVVLMIDTSNSTRFQAEDIQDAAITFVNQLRSDDRVMVVSFDDQIKTLSEFTNDRNRLRDAIRRTRIGSGTKLYDAVDLVINQRLSREPGRKAIVLFTDGVDTTSRRATYDSNLRDAEELDALVYPIQYDTYMDMAGGGGGTGGSVGWPGGGGGTGTVADILGQILGGMSRRSGGMGRGGPGTSRRDYDLANRYLQDLAERTGARRYQADTTHNLSLAFSNIAEELRRQYSLGYYPKNPAQAGQRRQIRVRVNQPNLAVRTRDSYVFNPPALADTAQQSAPVMQKKLDQSGKASTNP